MADQQPVPGEIGQETKPPASNTAGTTAVNDKQEQPQADPKTTTPQPSATSAPSTPAVSMMPQDKSAPASAGEASPSVQTTPEHSHAEPKGAVPETSVAITPPESTFTAQLQEKGISADEFRGEYIFGDPKLDRDRLIAQTMLFSDYIEKNAARLVGRNKESILDIGCGAGQLTSILRRVYPDARIIGMDSDPEAIARAKKDQDRLGSFEEPIDFVVGNAEEKLPDGQFDLIYISLVLLHLPNPIKTLELVKQSLKPGGLVWIKESIPDWGIHHPAYFKFGEIMSATMTKIGRNHNVYKQIPEMLEKLGFTDIKTEKENYPIGNDSLTARISTGVALGIFRNAIKMMAKVQNMPEEELIGLHQEMCRDANQLRGTFAFIDIIGTR